MVNGRGSGNHVAETGEIVNKRSDMLVQSLLVGAITGSSAGFVSAMIATLKNHPRKRVYVIGTTLNCFLLGSGFYATREVYAQKYPGNKLDSSGARKAIVTGAAAASVGGIWGAVIGGRRHAIPGFFVFGIAGLGGQLIKNIIDSNMVKQQESRDMADDIKNKEDTIISRILNSQKSPIRRLSNKEYASKLREKMLVLDADIALIDEEIDRLYRKLEEECSQIGKDS